MACGAAAGITINLAPAFADDAIKDTRRINVTRI